jgi:two-component system OmpR family response regulator
MTGNRVVLLESDNSYRGKLSRYLQIHGFDVVDIDTLDEVDQGYHDNDWAISLVNFGNNTGQGLEFLKANPRHHQGPVLVLADNDDHIDRIVCLELGADDYILKSTHEREILARIRVAARREPIDPVPSAPAKPHDADQDADTWRFSHEKREVMAPDGRLIDLTIDQFSLLDVLIKNSGKALSRKFLSRALFNRPLKAADRSIDNLVVRLRRKLGESARAPRIVKTARSGGYLFDGFPGPSSTKRKSFPN